MTIRLLIAAFILFLGRATSAPGQSTGIPLEKHLERIRKIVRTGGWPPVPPGPALSLGRRGDRVTLLRKRLAREGFTTLGDGCAGPEVFGPCLEEYLARFQRLHGLVADGVAGTETLRALNVPAIDRLHTVAANLRRRQPRLPSRGQAVRVNIPAFELQLFEDGRPVLTSRVVVGQPSRPTPEISSRLTTVVINPTWTIPDSIATTEVLPLLRQDPQFLREKKIRAYRWENGRLTLQNAASVPATDGATGFVLRQSPGAHNPMGPIKLLLPNAYSIFIHGTPETELFERRERAFSHGCVRVEKLSALVEHLIPEDGAWMREEVWNARWSEREIFISLKHPVPVQLAYRTAWSDEEGELHFRPDVYGKDGKE